MELSESLWIMYALLEQVKFWLTHSHLTIESEQALSGVVEWLEAHWLKCEVLRVASQHVESLLLGLLGVLDGHAVRISLFLVPNDLLSALVKINIEEDETLNSWHVVDLAQVEVNFHTSIDAMGC